MSAINRTNGYPHCELVRPETLAQRERGVVEVSHSDGIERKRIEEALIESEQRYRLLIDTAPVMVWISGTDGLCTDFNQPWLDFTGRTMEHELGEGWLEGVHHEDKQRCVDNYLAAFRHRESFTMQYRLRRSDGEYLWVLDNHRYRHPGYRHV
jgi:PAS domain S-box-containing protein